MAIIAMKKQSKHIGTALLEVLITVLLLSVGMFSNVQLMAEAITQLHNNKNHQRALHVNADLVEMLNSMPTAVTNSALLPVAHNCSASITCGQEEQLADLVSRWHQQITDYLPSARGQIITRSNGDTRMFELRITWPGAGNTAISQSSSYALITAP
jgi:Tfp pilus assembly protein PilV